MVWLLRLVDSCVHCLARSGACLEPEYGPPSAPGHGLGSGHRDLVQVRPFLEVHLDANKALRLIVERGGLVGQDMRLGREAGVTGDEYYLTESKNQPDRLVLDDYIDILY
jgi:hypothetical protein